MSTIQVMIVEDKAQVALDVRDCLEMMKYGVTGICGSGEEAVIMAGKKRPDVVLMDILLREKMNAIEAAGQIYSRFRIPVIFLSAHTDQNLLDQAKMVGSFGYLVKPFRENELKANIEMALQKAQIEKECDFANMELLRTKSALESILDSIIPISVTDFDYNLLKVNNAYLEIFNKETKPLDKCYQSRNGEYCRSEECPIRQIQSGQEEVSYESCKQTRYGKKTFLINSRPYLDTNGTAIGAIQTFQDITERILKEAKNRELIRELRAAMDEVQTLRGIIPICMYCKEIRDEKGYWNGLEKYISEHSEAEFSHGICEKCYKKQFGFLDDQDNK